jgi:hypothetical protein
MADSVIKCLVSGKDYIMKGIHFFAVDGGERVNAYVSTYTSIGGPKAVMLSIDDECGGHYTPWNTWYGAKDMPAAIEDAKSWAEAENVPCFIH